jgi:hypothetical protein
VVGGEGGGGGSERRRRNNVQVTPGMVVNGGVVASRGPRRAP